LDKSTAKSSKYWKATGKITVHDTNEALVSGATVTGTWSGGYTGSATCTTGSSGTCSVTSGSIANTKSSVTFTANKLAKTGFGFDPSKNHDPESDSNGTVITVLKQ
jgi:serine protease AprX